MDDFRLYSVALPALDIRTLAGGASLSLLCFNPLTPPPTRQLSTVPSCFHRASPCSWIRCWLNSHGIAIVGKGMLLHYKFDERNGTVIHDYSGNLSHGWF